MRRIPIAAARLPLLEAGAALSRFAVPFAPPSGAGGFRRRKPGQMWAAGGFDCRFIRDYTQDMSVNHLRNLVGDRLRTLPILVLYLTDGCNSRCVTCDIWRNPRRNMKMELVEAIAGDMRALSVRWVVLSGGEAMQ
ncbi:MAG: hypothetical protein IT319_16940, partial [Anaerolineae bacterium]|nr:hypothetical protein [Anaerolineae bacterium]